MAAMYCGANSYAREPRSHAFVGPDTKLYAICSRGHPEITQCWVDIMLRVIRRIDVGERKHPVVQIRRVAGRLAVAGEQSDR